MASYCAYDSPTPEYYSDAATCTRVNSFFGGTAVLPEGAGYGIVIGFGVFFSLATGIIMKLNQRYGGLNLSSEFFNTAGRNVKTGLTASVIVSQWTWAATLLQSSNVAYQYGVSGPFWYASGATIQVLLRYARDPGQALRAECPHHLRDHRCSLGLKRAEGVSSSAS